MITYIKDNNEYEINYYFRNDMIAFSINVFDNANLSHTFQNFLNNYELSARVDLYDEWTEQVIIDFVQNGIQLEI